MLAARTHHGLRASCCARPSTCTAHTYVDYMYRYIAVSLSAQHSFRLMRNTCTISYWKFLLSQFVNCLGLCDLVISEDREEGDARAATSLPRAAETRGV